MPGDCADSILKRNAPTFEARPDRDDASMETSPPQMASDQGSVFTPFFRDSWLNEKTALRIWAAIVAACVVWQPLLLGFYYDDWDLWVNGSTKGSPFSLARLVYMNFTNPVRVGCLPGRFLGSSLFGAHPFLWQAALLLVNCGIAVSIVALGRALTQGQTRASRTITAAAGLCWLLVPWNAGARYWPALLPNVSMLAVLGFLCVLLIRGWETNRSRAIVAGALYLWACVSYEAFYLQWLTIILIGLVLWMAKRVPLKPVLVSGISLMAAQGIAGAWNLYTKSRGYWTAMGVLPDWRQIAGRNLLNVVPAALGSVAEISGEFVICGVIVVVIALAVYVRAVSRASERLAACTSSLLVGIPVAGGLLSIVVFSLAGRTVAGTGVDSRSLMVFNFWAVIAGAVLTIFTIERLRGLVKAIFALALVGFGLCLAAGQILRASDWVTAWDKQKKILTEAPVSDLKRTAQDARIVLVNPREVNGAPVFAAGWDINIAIPWAYPFLQGRKFIVYNPWQGPMKWDGNRLSYPDGAVLETTSVLYLWRPADLSFWRADEPFVINQNLTIEPAH